MVRSFWIKMCVAAYVRALKNQMNSMVRDAWLRTWGMKTASVVKLIVIWWGNNCVVGDMSCFIMFYWNLSYTYSVDGKEMQKIGSFFADKDLAILAKNPYEDFIAL